ncbi:MAG: LysR family transcriptional regulator [Clostridia bacterium]|nr:LysR family transcriptional regulator [Clostridia bacterium]
MEIRVLRYFLETAREGNMTRAAARLFVSQPTMSKQLKELERELGAKLFVRSNYSIKLTEAGALLRERAEDIISLVDKTEAEFKSLEDVTVGDIYVGAPESEGMSAFAEAARDLQRAYPKIRCNIYSGNRTDVCERLDKGLLDLAIVMGYVDLSKYNYLGLPMKDTWGVLMRKDDPLAEKESFAISELAALPLICSRQWLEQEAPQWFPISAGELKVAATYTLVFNGAVMVKAGMGYAVVLDKLVSTGLDSDLAFRPLEGVGQTDLYVIWRKQQAFTPAAELLVRELRKRFQ